jgi:clan AA aspartic protease (TIGR02281 family)
MKFASDRIPPYTPKPPPPPPPPPDYIGSLKKHALLLAPPGVGKTQFIQNLTLELLRKRPQPTVIIINSQGKLLERIQRLAIFAPGQPLSDRVVIIDPEDEIAPAINMFALPKERMRSYSWKDKEQLHTNTLQLLRYMFSSLGSELTGKQTTAFAPLMELMFAIPDATFNTLLDILQEKPKKQDGKQPDETGEFSDYQEYIQTLDDHDRRFFDNQFFTRTYAETKVQITQRINAIVAQRSFRRMIGTPENRFDLYTLMERGSIIFVNTSKNLLGTDGSAFFGRWIMSLIVRAAYERMHDTNPRQTYILVDEASDYTDSLFEELLEKVRQFQVACLLAFQGTYQFRTSKAILSLTAVKLCGLVEHDDAQIMAPQLRTNPDFLKALPFRENIGTQFACFVRGVSEAASKIPVDFTIFDTELKMSQPQYEQLLKNNRERFGVRNQPPIRKPSHAIPSDPRGHVYAEVFANGVPIRMMVDTGASDICFSRQDAAKVGINVEGLSFNRAVATANGIGYTAAITLRSLRIDRFEINDIPAYVAQNMDGSLLGQEFLRRLPSYEMKNGVLTFNWPDPPVPKPQQPSASSPPKNIDLDTPRQKKRDW